MAFNVKLEIVPEQLETRLVEVPDKCPHCAMDLHESTSIREVAFTTTTAEGAVDIRGFEPSGSSKTWHETEHVTDYECVSCGKSVVRPIK
jgi:hypothetical protein